VFYAAGGRYFISFHICFSYLLGVKSTQLEMSNFIPLEKDIEMTTLYRQQREVILADQFKNKNILVRSEVFSRAQVEKLLAKPECQQLRIYYGMDPDLAVHALLVAVDGANVDLITSFPAASNSQHEEILEEAHRCPPHCPPASPLNA
jgi:hypothetical protein